MPNSPVPKRRSSYVDVSNTAEFLELQIEEFCASNLPTLSVTGVHERLAAIFEHVADLKRENADLMVKLIRYDNAEEMHESAVKTLAERNQLKDSIIMQNENAIRELQTETKDLKEHLDQALDDNSKQRTESEQRFAEQGRALADKTQECKHLENELNLFSELLNDFKQEKETLSTDISRLNEEVAIVRGKLGRILEELRKEKKVTQDLKGQKEKLDAEKDAALEELRNVTKNPDESLEAAKKVVGNLVSASSALVASVDVDRFKKELEGLSETIRWHCEDEAHAPKRSENRPKPSEVYFEEIEAIRKSLESCETKIVNEIRSGRENKCCLYIRDAVFYAEKNLSAMEDGGNEKVQFEKKRLRLHIDYLLELLDYKLSN